MMAAAPRPSARYAPVLGTPPSQYGQRGWNVQPSGRFGRVRWQARRSGTSRSASLVHVRQRTEQTLGIRMVRIDRKICSFAAVFHDSRRHRSRPRSSQTSRHHAEVMGNHNHGGVELALAARLIISSTCAWMVTSSAVVGSSASSSSGSHASAIAMTTRCFMPPEN